MKARIINSTDFGGVYDTDYQNDEWIFTDILPSIEIKKPVWNGAEWIEGLTDDEIAEQETKNTIFEIKQKYEFHKSNGWNAYQDFRAMIVVDISQGKITEVQAFQIEASLKVAYDRIAQTGDWKTAYHELSNVVVLEPFIQPYMDLALNYISNYITNNYDS